MDQTNYKARNLKVLSDLEAVFEKLTYGSVDVQFVIHERRITKIIIHGKELKKY